MRKLIPLPTIVLFVLATPAFHARAELYKHVDENGNVIYSDQASGSAKPVEPPGLTSYSPPKTHTQPASELGATQSSPKQVTSYAALNIKSPANDATIRDNAGNITVQIELNPKLNTKAGHKLVLLLDNKATGDTQGTEIALSNVDRGTHSLTVQVIDGNGQVLKLSRPTTIHLLRPTVIQGRKSGK